MIKLEGDKMTAAIAKAKATRPKIRVVSADERTYAVTGSRGGNYTVKFAVANGHKSAECDCLARGMRYQIAAAASVNIGIQSMRRQAAPAAEPVATKAATRDELISSVKRAWPKTWPPLGAELLARFGKSHLEMLDTNMLRRVRLAIAM